MREGGREQCRRVPRAVERRADARLWGVGGREGGRDGRTDRRSELGREGGRGVARTHKIVCGVCVSVSFECAHAVCVSLDVCTGIRTHTLCHTHSHTLTPRPICRLGTSGAWGEGKNLHTRVKLGCKSPAGDNWAMASTIMVSWQLADSAFPAGSLNHS